MKEKGEKAGGGGERTEILPLVVPTFDEFNEWVDNKGFTSLTNLLDGYAVIHDTHRRVKDDAVEDPEGLVFDAINQAEIEIESDIYNLFACAFKDFAERKGGER